MRQFQIAPQPQIMRPDQAILTHREADQSANALLDAPLPNRTRFLHFRPVAKGWLHDDLNAHAWKFFAETAQPGSFRSLARGQHYRANRFRPVRHQMRRGQFNYTPHPSRPEMMMNYDESHGF